MHPDTLSAAWAFFDRIYCISLKDRQDRRDRATSAFARVGLADRVEFVVVDRHPTNCEQGIYESHMRCIQKGVSTGAQTILIFEDDVIFDRFEAKRLAACTEYLMQQSQWRLLFLGALVKAIQRCDTPAIQRVSYRCLAHAYALNRPYAQQLADIPWRNIPFDAVLGHLDGDKGAVYACYPMFAFQSDAATDNANHARLDSFRRWCGGLQRIQKLNEWYHRNKTLVIALHFIVALLVAWMVIMKYGL